MTGARMRFSKAGLLVALCGLALLCPACLAAGCAPEVTTTTVPSASISGSTTDSQTAVTLLNMELDLTWSPPESLPETDRATISQTLERLGARALFPSAAPAGIDGPLSAGLWVTRTVPTNIVSVSVFVRTPDGQPLLSVTSGDSTWADSSDWQEVQVRGAPGRFYDNGVGVRFLAWSEGGRTYSVESGGPLSAEQLIAWLDSWYALP